VAAIITTSNRQLTVSNLVWHKGNSAATISLMLSWRVLGRVIWDNCGATMWFLAFSIRPNTLLLRIRCPFHLLSVFFMQRLPPPVGAISSACRTAQATSTPSDDGAKSLAHGDRRVDRLSAIVPAGVAPGFGA
tara:strand:- start:3265 stop:3663 length:399 start_codon:yes stop_codon:yes gene_type:complete